MREREREKKIIKKIKSLKELLFEIENEVLDLVNLIMPLRRDYYSYLEF
jgi:hypothetical protein